MKNKVFGIALALSIFFATLISANTFAVTTITIAPADNTVSLDSGTKRDYAIKVKNTGVDSVRVRVYAAPYSIPNDNYEVDFSTYNQWNQLTNWLTFLDDDEAEQKELNFTLSGGEDKTLTYIITVPETGIPDGGQYATIFAEANGSKGTTNGLNVSGRVGATVYGETDGTSVRSGDILSVDAPTFMTSGKYVVTSRVKNDGNVNLSATREIKIESLYGQPLHLANDNASVFPGTTRTITTEWKDVPALGVFRVTYNLYYLGDVKEVSLMLVVMPVWMMVVIAAGTVALLGLIVIGIKTLVKKLRK